jgi:hypothetical protein
MVCGRSSSNDLDVAFIGIVYVGTKKVDMFPWLSSNRLLACCPIVLYMMLQVMAFVPHLCARFLLAKHFYCSVKV